MNAIRKRLAIVRPFTETEAWWLFRAAATAEAVGWTLLVTAVLARHFKCSWYTYAIPIAGRIHGTFFIAYFLVVLATVTSLRWRWQLGITALAAGIPPYGSLLFEVVIGHFRSRQIRKQYLSLIMYYRMTKTVLPKRKLFK